MDALASTRSASTRCAQAADTDVIWRQHVIRRWPQASQFAWAQNLPQRLVYCRLRSLHDWLDCLDDGAGCMLRYFDVLSCALEGSLKRLADMQRELGASPWQSSTSPFAIPQELACVVAFTKTGHKMLFLRGIRSYRCRITTHTLPVSGDDVHTLRGCPQMSDLARCHGIIVSNKLLNQRWGNAGQIQSSPRLMGGESY